MTDLDTLLSQAAHAPVPPAPESLVDADVARGHRALVHRTMRRTGTRSVLAATVAVGTFAAVHASGHPAGATGTTALRPPTQQVHPAGATGTTALRPPTQQVHPTVAPTVKLVAYTGAQPAGYTVDSVPAGWEIQGVNHFALTIAPVGYADQSLDDFAGKLAVMLLSQDVKAPTDGVPVDLGVPGTGRISHSNPGEPILTFQDSAGRWLDIQVPASLHWSDAQVVAFGAAVHANGSAVAGRG
jgi:hypothetical protein